MLSPILNPIGIWLVAGAVQALPAPGRARRVGSTEQVGRDRPPARAAVDPLAASTALDVMAACLRAGLPVAAAATAAAGCAPDRLAESLRRSADLLALGAEPADAWQQPGADDATQSLARLARRSARSGSSLATEIAELADHLRETAVEAAVARAERASVLIAGPLGLCFLPAFVCLGIVPVVIGLARHVLTGGLL